MYKIANTNVPESDALSAVQLRVVKLEKDVSKLKKIDHSAKALATLKSQVSTVVEQYLGPKIGDDLQKSASTKESVEEPIAELVLDDAGKDVVRDDDQPQDTSKPKTVKTPNPEWFKQPPRPPTPDSEWNKRHVVLGQPE
ncbi:hypothetical protein Tco_0653615 [Tanacetum coccineum]|uniref:Uncharacterized protein n=1 Tax=Tanacetum coccineum TaxID=301880 RepID=A0ABQ4X1N0_9ASTR